MGYKWQGTKIKIRKRFETLRVKVSPRLPWKAIVLSVIAGVIVARWHPFQSKIPWDVYISENRMRLLVLNSLGEVVSDLPTKAEITKHLFLDIDGDNKKELLVATASKGENEPTGKLLLYNSGKWNDFYVPQNDFGDSVAGIQDFDALREIKALAMLVNSPSEWTGRLVLLDYSGSDPITKVMDSSKYGCLYSVMAFNHAEWNRGRGLFTFLIRGWGLYESHEKATEENTGTLGSKIIHDGGEGVAPFYYSVGFYEAYRVHQQLEVEPVWIFRVEPKGTFVRTFHEWDSDDNKKTDFLTFWHSYGYQYKFTPTLVEEWSSSWGPTYFSLRPKIEFVSASSEAYMSREQICFQLVREDWFPKMKKKWCDLENN